MAGRPVRGGHGRRGGCRPGVRRGPAPDDGDRGGGCRRPRSHRRTRRAPAAAQRDPRAVEPHRRQRRARRPARLGGRPARGRRPASPSGLARARSPALSACGRRRSRSARWSAWPSGACGRRRGTPAAAVVASATVVTYRIGVRGPLPRRPGQPAGRRVPAEDLPFVVPLEARDPLRRHRLRARAGRRARAARTGRTRADVGIVASLDELAGPDFDPAAVDPLVREFYEHTTRFRLDIVPEWRPGCAPATCSTARSWPARSARPTCP